MSTATKEYTQKRRIGIVCTVGTRDLTLDGQTAEKLGKAGNTEFASPRKLGKEILDDWDNLSKRIAFPIIQPVIDSAFERARSSQGEIVYLLLVGTDQPTLIEETHREKDTAYFTEVAVNYYSQQSQRPSKSFQAKRLLYPMNPTRMDIAWNYLQQKASKECFTELRNCDQVFLSTTGGVPGLNQALLMFLFSEVCGRNLSFVHVDEDLQRPIPIEIVQHLTRLETIHRIEAYVETFDFAAMARELLEEDQEGIRLIAQAAGKRLTFDFKGADHLLTQALGSFKTVSQEQLLRQWLSQLAVLSGRNTQDMSRARTMLMRELVANLIIKVRCEEWVDFLGRWYRLIEEAMKQFIAQYLGLALIFDDRQTQYSDYIHALESRTDVHEFFSVRKASGRTLNWREINTKTGEAWLEFIDLHSPTTSVDLAERARKFLVMLKRYSGLISLRNKCILAHGNQGVGRNEILDALNGTSIELFQKELCQVVLGLDDPDAILSDFQAMSELILKTLKTT